MSIDQKLHALGIVLPVAAAPVANYVGFVRAGNLLIISGQLPLAEGKIAPEHLGHVGKEVTPEHAKAAARLSLINVLAQAKTALGSLDKIERCIRLGGFINATPEFTALPPIMNGASDTIVEVLGDKGRHARTTIGVASLPLNACVEVEAMFEVKA